MSKSGRFLSVRALGLALILALAGLGVSMPAGAAPNHTKIVSAVPAATTPGINNGETDAIVQVGNQVIAGGTFTTVTAPSGTAQTRNFLFAFNASTGQISSTFVPVLNGSVMDVVAGPTADTVYVGGTFTQVNGVAASHLTLLNVNTGLVSGSFRAASTNGVVNTLISRSNRLYVGGNFTTAGGVAHGGLASMNPTTGALDPFVKNQVTLHHNDTGSGAQGSVGVRDIDVNVAGTRMVAIGNFKKVDGIARDQAVVISLNGPSSAVTADWNTNRYQPYCFNFAFDTYMRGVSFSPDGSYFVITATGGQNAGTLCDTAARFETGASGSAIQPTWVDYTGGDTLWSVAVTEKAVYVGGHQRWLNNSLASDTAGPGAVPRPGLAALNTRTGLPMTWNPGRNPRGAAVYALYPTSTGLWMGSDTEYVGAHFAYKRPRIAFFPLATGTAEAADTTAGIPGTAYLGGPTSVNGNILFRVNAGGSTVGAVDNGPDWAADDAADNPLRNSGSNAAGWGTGATTDSTVPSSTPNAIFDSERWSPSDSPAMDWAFPAPVGAPLQVRLYFANRCSCTSGVGQRVFDAAIDGNTVLDNFDIVAQPGVGDQRGTMRSFNITSDGTVNIDFSHVTENPLINGIEIVRTDQAPPAPGGDTLQSVNLTSSAASPAAAQPSGGVEWSRVRGSFEVGGKLFYGFNDGNFYSRTVTGSTFGAATKIDPYNDPIWAGIDTGSGNTYDGKPNNLYSQMTGVTGMAYDGGKLYYTLSGSSNLFWRWFNVDSGIIGADEFTATAGRDWNGTMGMFAASGKLYFVTKANGNLNSIALAADGPTGSATVVDGPGSGGNDWRVRALFLGASTVAPPNVPPTARYTATCVDLTCTFDASASTDTDGSIASYAWTFGDTTSGTGQTVTHTYGSAQDYTAVLTVRDNQNATGTQSKTVSPTAPVQPNPNITFVGKSVSSANTAGPTITVPAQAAANDTLLLTASVNNAPTVTTPAGWTLLSSRATTGLTSYVWTRKATATDAGTPVTVSLSALGKTTMAITAYRGVSLTTPVAAFSVATDAATNSHTTPTLIVPSGSLMVSYWADKSPNTAQWTAPAGVTARAESYATGTGRVSTFVADAAGPTAGGSVAGVTATTDVVSTRGISWTIALAPGN